MSDIIEIGQPLYGGPTKRFFVSMLTRDIDLVAAILDLIDNCVDGAMRSLDGALDGERPFDGYWAEITINDKEFIIVDNCGGIPWEIARDHAFRLGRPDIQRDGHLPTIGMYGIGMKRAIFKMAEEATVTTQTKNEAYSVSYTKAWLDAENDLEWDLPIREEEKPLSADGTKITVSTLKPDIALKFGRDSSVVSDLESSIRQLFGFIMESGFEIRVNGTAVVPDTLKIHMSVPADESGGTQGGITPYVFSTTEQGVQIDVIIGFRGPLPRESDIWDEQEGKRTSEDAGVSVICNDRIVILNDKTRLTGWGDGNVPKYHNQFIAIAGLIFFRSNNADLLPISTTKRGLDQNSDMYFLARAKAMEGIKKFTDFTNKWKGMEEETEVFFQDSPRAPARESLQLAAKHGKGVRLMENAKRLTPTLPMPSTKDPFSRIRYSKPKSEVEIVSEILFGASDIDPSEVGKGSFEYVLKLKDDG